MFNVIKREFEYGGMPCVLETGRIARQATSSVMVTVGNVTVFVAVVAKASETPRDFFPLTVNYQEKTYAAGKIPGGFLKREGRPSEKETLTCRLIDRPIRPLFPKGFDCEVQVTANVVSTDKLQDPDIAALIGVSAALSISGLPFGGPIGAARVGFVDGMYVINPSYDQLETSELDLVVAGTDKAVLMVESEAKQLTEDQMLGAVLFGQQELQKVVSEIKAFAEDVNTAPWDWTPPEEDLATLEKVKAQSFEDIAAAYQLTDKMARYERLGQLKEQAFAALCVEDDSQSADDLLSKDAVKAAFGKLEKSIVRDNVINGLPRIDGRAHDVVRPIDIDVGLLPHVHGSVLFTRGETQALVAATLGSNRDGQLIDALEGSRTDNFMLHYNFPPYCVGEVGMAMSPKRREIGHGRLARRGLEAVLPSEQDFPYVVRVVSDITESNGSSSMASICGGCMAMMDAGVPLSDSVAGIAMGLVKEGDKFAILSDILGDEDHLGDMDFKVAGTKNGVTALQMDIKIDGITEEIMEQALNQAKKGRLHILECMQQAINAPRTEVSEHAPQFTTYKINPDKIRDVIGKGGATIRALCEETKATIDIDDDGTVKVYGEDKASCDAALQRIKDITAVPEVGKIYEGVVEKIVDFGAFVNFLGGGTTGLVHISQIAEERVENVGDYLKEGQTISVKVLELDQRGRIKLSVKAAQQESVETE